jgi:phosphatidylserine/phosphatidylglycerophosphate/cardiolipin synthase-like enzyme
LLKNAAGNYPVWLEAIRQARHKIYFENYFIVEVSIALLIKAHSLRTVRRSRGLPTTRVGRADLIVMQDEQVRARK